MNTIKEFMKEKGMTQAELAAELGYSQPHIANVINGKDAVSDAFRYRWLNTFGVETLRYLNGDTEPAQ